MRDAGTFKHLHVAVYLQPRLVSRVSLFTFRGKMNTFVRPAFTVRPFKPSPRIFYTFYLYHYDTAGVLNLIGQESFIRFLGQRQQRRLIKTNRNKRSDQFEVQPVSTFIRTLTFHYYCHIRNLLRVMRIAYSMWIFRLQPHFPYKTQDASILCKHYVILVDC